MPGVRDVPEELGNSKSNAVRLHQNANTGSSRCPTSWGVGQEASAGTLAGTVEDLIPIRAADCWVSVGRAMGQSWDCALRWRRPSARNDATTIDNDQYQLLTRHPALPASWNRTLKNTV
jgi:hypothetical protein